MYWSNNWIYFVSRSTFFLPHFVKRRLFEGDLFVVRISSLTENVSYPSVRVSSLTVSACRYFFPSFFGTDECGISFSQRPVNFIWYIFLVCKLHINTTACMDFIAWTLPHELIFYLFCVLFSDPVHVRTMLPNIHASTYPLQSGNPRQNYFWPQSPYQQLAVTFKLGIFTKCERVGGFRRGVAKVFAILIC